MRKIFEILLAAGFLAAILAADPVRKISIDTTCLVKNVWGYNGRTPVRITLVDGKITEIVPGREYTCLGSMDLDDLMDLEEDFIKYCVRWALDNCKDDLEFLNKMIDKGLIERLEGVLREDFVRLDYTEGIRILQQAIKDGRKFEFPCNWGDDLASEHERYLVEEYFKKPVIMTHYPKAIKAFYMKIDEKNPVLDGQEMAQTVQGTDVLFPQIGEIIGGSVREEDYGKLMGEIEERNIPMKDMWWYLDTRKFGSCPHAGFGLGFERLILFVTGMQNIRDVIPFPRTPKSAEF